MPRKFKVGDVVARSTRCPRRLRFYGTRKIKAIYRAPNGRAIYKLSRRVTGYYSYELDGYPIDYARRRKPCSGKG